MFHLKLALDFPEKVVDEEVVTKALTEEEKQEQRRADAFKSAFAGAGNTGQRPSFWDKNDKDYVSPYLTCSECNHIAFIDSVKLRRKFCQVAGSKIPNIVPLTLPMIMDRAS